MPNHQAHKKHVVGGIHPKKFSAVTLRLGEEESEKVREAAKNTGRSVAGFVRFAALQMVNEVSKECV